MRFLLAEARDRMAAAGAAVGMPDDDEIVRIPRELIDEALRTAPPEVRVHTLNPERAVIFGGNHVIFAPVGGPPFVSDLDRGRRPGTLADYEAFTRLTGAFDVLHANSPTIEPLDVAVSDRHLMLMRTQLRLNDKLPFLFTRGRARVADSFAMLRIAASLDEDEFRHHPMCWGNVNTNSPRQLDVPMTLGIIDFALAGQVMIVTPFTLAGAMAPVSLAGALLLQHLEVLAGVTLAQVTNPGTPSVYGGFTSNVDMRSGSPAFGTPTAVKGAIASGQLARHCGLPFRSSGSSSSLTEDAQGSLETLINMSGALQGGANIILHSAGWQEGGLCASYEKFILDVEMLNIIAEAWQPIDMTEAELAYDTLAEVQPGSHFFGAPHTLERFEQAFYEPLVHTRANFEQWVEEGSADARARANRVWKRTLEDYEPPPTNSAIDAELDDFVGRRIVEGGAAVD